MSGGAILDLLRDRRASAAVEMALAAPLLLLLLFSAAEVGNYFLDAHTLDKAVRDGARFAARQSFAYYPDSGCGAPDSTNVVTPTKSVVKYGYLSGGSLLLTPNIQDSDISVTTQCFSGPVGGSSGPTMSGLYKVRANGAQIVQVKASVSYKPVLGVFGFTGLNMQLNAESQAAVTGL